MTHPSIAKLARDVRLGDELVDGAAPRKRGRRVVTHIRSEIRDDVMWLSFSVLMADGSADVEMFRLDEAVAVRDASAQR